MRRAGDKENKRDEERGWGGEEERREVLILDNSATNMKYVHCQVDENILQDRNLENKKIIRNWL